MNIWNFLGVTIFVFVLLIGLAVITTFVILGIFLGTDFYRTRCNMPSRSSEKRTYQVFYSHDPLAKAAKLAGHDICWIDFANVPEESELGRQISEYTYMGNLGEGYSIIMRFLPPSYRIFQPPAVLYDSMIFVSEAVPTKIASEE